MAEPLYPPKDQMIVPSALGDPSRPQRWPGDLPAALEAARAQGRREAENEYGKILRQMEEDRRAKEMQTPGLVDELKELVTYGDIVIRKVANGYIIRRIPGHYMHANSSGAMVETWVVEGNDIKAAADQLTAIQADDAMRVDPHQKTTNTMNASGGMAGSSIKINYAPSIKDMVDTDIINKISGANKP